MLRITTPFRFRHTVRRLLLLLLLLGAHAPFVRDDMFEKADECQVVDLLHFLKKRKNIGPLEKYVLYLYFGVVCAGGPFFTLAQSYNCVLLCN